MESWDTVYNPNPRENANIFSVLFFGYTIPLFRKGLSKEIGVEDLYNTLNNDKSNYLGDTLEANWNEQLKSQTLDPKKKPSLLKAILKTFWLEYSSVVLLAGVAYLVLKPLQPQLLGGILDYYTPGSTQTKSKTYLYAFAFVFFTIINSLIFSHLIKKSWHCGIRVKTAVCALIYRKTIRLSKTALGDTPAGKVVNLLSNDVSRFEFASLLLNGLWTGPACALIVIINLYQLSGLPCLAGILIVMLVSPMQGYSGKLAAKFRKQTALKTDERIRLIDEIILSIQVIKMYAWEKPFEKIVTTVRKAELKIIKRNGYVINIFSAFNMITIKVALFVTLLTIILSGEQITASKVFVLISYYNMLSEILSTKFVSSVSLVAEAVASMDRLQQILIKDEYKYEQFRNIISSSDEKSEIILSVDNLSARWNTTITECVLKNVNLEIKRGQLVGIIGPVGSGKSALLQTFLGELDIFKGTIKSRGKYSYAAQESWIFAGTIRQNILFGATYEKVRYKKVLRVCALVTDLKEFPNGDMTIVGEKGASLSGGQKARINLARAIYRDVDIYLLDDPLSAVDIHVSKVLYEECINNFLANKTRILVTHQVHYLKNADNVIILNNGIIEMTGIFKELATDVNEYSKSLDFNESIHSDRSRTSSTSSYVSQKSFTESSIGDSDNEDNKPKMVDMQEKSSKGKVFGSLLLKYLRSTNNYINLALTVALFLLVQTAICGVDYFISVWTSIEESRMQASFNNTTVVFNNCVTDIDSSCTNSTTIVSREIKNITTLGNSATTAVYMFQTPNTISNHISSYNINSGTTGFESLQWTSKTCIYIYGGLIVSVIILTLLRAFTFFNLIISCSQNLHSSLFRGVINTKMRFFETNPSGRILNRFTKDIGEIDEAIPKVLQEGSEVFLQMAGALALVLLVNPYTIIVGIALTIILTYVQHNYLKIANDFRRIQGIVRSPVFTHINATLQGLTTIRALGTENLLVEEFDKIQDTNSSASLMSICSSTVYGFALDCISFVFMSILTFSILIFDEAMGVNGSIVGLAISQAFSLSTEIRLALRSTANISNQLMAVERVLEYRELSPESQSANPKNTPPNWPDEGYIIFDNINLKYVENGPLILKNMNLRINPREKVGIVGRTGAGKTSLVTSLFRLAVVEGTLIIDGFDTKDVPLTTLRSKISIIPQDPVLFTGTLRSNLDPLEKFSDEELYKALEDVELKDPKNINNKLQSTVLDKGSNYSVGQKQLICLARALLRKNKILVLDEATANVDPQTDAIIQKTLRTKFVDCTVITVAHRLNTIMDSDKVLVMGQGEVVEFDHPHILLNNTDGVFFKMVQETGKELAEYLSTIAMHSYQRSVTLRE